MRINKSLIRKAGLIATASLLICSAAFCTAVRICRVGIPVSINSFAARTTLPTGNNNYRISQTASSATAKNKEKTESSNSEKSEISEEENSSVLNEAVKETDSQPAPTEFETSTVTEEDIKIYDKEHEGEEQFPVLEFTSTDGNISYNGVQVKNTASKDIDIKKELESELGFTIEKSDEPQVLIYHTHTSESFLDYDTGYYYESFYPRSQDKSKNVCAIGDEIAKQLNAAGIVTIHDTTVHDNPSYNGAYDRSMETIYKNLKKYPSIKVVLDIHRDGIGTDTQRSKPVFTVNGKKAAQIMILAGYNYDNDEEYTDWEYNLRFALQIQKTAAKMYPDMVRPLSFGDFMYNMNVNTGSLLIEVGADSNTVEEVRYTGYLLGNVLKEVLDPDKKYGTKNN